MGHPPPAPSTSRKPAPSRCADCGASLAHHYFLVDDAPTCDDCRAALDAPVSARMVARAAGFGLAGALAGAALHWAVRAALSVEVGYASLVIGFLVGAGVRRGARRRGLGLQLIAVALTYLAIALAYLPTMLAALSEHGIDPHGPRQLLHLGGMVLSLPLRIGLAAPKSLVITAIALIEAWKLTKPRAGIVAGPHALPSVSAAPPTRVAPAVAAPPPPSQPVPPPAPSPTVAPLRVVAVPSLRVDPDGGTLLDRAARQIAAEQADHGARLVVATDPSTPRSPPRR